MLHYLTIPVTAFQQNSSLVWCDQTMEAAVIDPGGDLDLLLAEAQRLGLHLKAIWLTHAHIDHAGGTGELAQRLGLLDAETTLEAEKQLVNVHGTLALPGNAAVAGYEIHMGVTHGPALARPVAHLADGCQIEGDVEGSILFPGVKVGKGSQVKNCILFKNTVVEDGVTLGCVIADKDVHIRRGGTLIGHESYPLAVSKGSIV